MSVWAAALPLVEPNTEREREKEQISSEIAFRQSNSVREQHTVFFLLATVTHAQAAQAIASISLVHAGHHMAIYKRRKDTEHF